MRISDIGCTPGTVSARFQFERQPSDPVAGFIEGDVVSDTSALVLASWLPSWASGDRVISLAGTVCPVLVANLDVAAETIRRWYPDMPAHPPRIEAQRCARPFGTGRAAFISGGVDSLSMVQDLKDHIEAAVLVDYQDIGGISAAETELRFQKRSEICQRLCSDLGLEFRAVRTNLRGLNTSMNFWTTRYHGSFLAAVAHSLPFGEMVIAGTYDVGTLAPWGSHPLLDPFYSSSRVTIRHHGLHQSRLDKVRTLENWPMALDLMNVCTSGESRGRNCGKCEKCIRTRLELMVLGLPSRAFPRVAVDAEELHGVRIASPYAWSCYEDLLPRLPGDLAEIIERKRPGAQNTLRGQVKNAAKRILQYH